MSQEQLQTVQTVIRLVKLSTLLAHDYKIWLIPMLESGWNACRFCKPYLVGFNVGIWLNPTLESGWHMGRFCKPFLVGFNVEIKLKYCHFLYWITIWKAGKAGEIENFGRAALVSLCNGIQLLDSTASGFWFFKCTDLYYCKSFNYKKHSLILYNIYTVVLNCILIECLVLLS